MPNNYEQHRFQIGRYKNKFTKKHKTIKWDKISKNKYIKNFNLQGVSFMVFLYIIITFGILLSTYSMTSKQDLFVNNYTNFWYVQKMAVMNLKIYYI